MNRVKDIQEGFILPTVLAISLAIVTIMVTVLMVTSSAFGGTYIDYYQKLADEAAEAGAAYATACLSLSSTHEQTWGPAASKPNLTPNSDCSGTNTVPGNTYVYSSSTFRTYFVVGNLDYSVQFSAQISSTGYTELLRPDGSVEKTYSSIQKKIITWPTDVSGQMSASGTNRTCAIVNDAVYCWGFNRFGQLGDGQFLGGSSSLIETASSVDSTVPVKVVQQTGVMAGKKIVKIFVAQYHSCALDDAGAMYCWGYNGFGQLGRGNTTSSAATAVPAQVGGLLAGKAVTDIGGTSDTSCAIAEGKIYCWGYNSAGQLGIGSTTNSYTPTAVATNNASSNNLPTTYAATKLSTSGSRSQTMCAIANSKAYCWGSNIVGSIGDDSTVQKNLPTKVYDSGGLSGKTVTTISQDGPASSEYAHACAIASGIIYCWGENSYGQLGDNTQTDSDRPVAVIASGELNGKTIQDVKVGSRHSCARASDGVYCWGIGSTGQIGDGSNNNRLVPTAVAVQTGALTASNVISIGAGANRGCAVVTDGRTFCWGLNSSGQIGDGTTENRNVPTESLFLRPVGNQYIF